MRNFLFAFAAPSLTAAVIASAACSSNDAATTPSPPVDAGADVAVEASPETPPCEPQVAGPNPGTVAESRALGSGAAAAWLDPTKAFVPDETFARATFDTFDKTEELRISGFGFNLPASAKIVGFGAELRRQASDATVADLGIALFSGDTKSPVVKSVETPWPTKIVGTHVYGGQDMWDLYRLRPADVNSASFGISLTAKRTSGGGGDGGAPVANVDALRLIVYYCN